MFVDVNEADNLSGQEINDDHFRAIDADIDAPEAWNITIGNSNIVIAVIDQGVTSNHPDLPNSRQVKLRSSDFIGTGVSSINDTSPYETTLSGKNQVHHK